MKKILPYHQSILSTIIPWIFKIFIFVGMHLLKNFQSLFCCTAGQKSKICASGPDKLNERRNFLKKAILQEKCTIKQI
jgi:hypothetical protein